MLSDYLNLLFLLLRDLPAFAFSASTRKIAAIFHHYTYKPLPLSQTKNVVVVGGSFTGYFTAKHLTETLPTGYRVVLIEKNSHFNYVFAFPRFSVIGGYEKYAFIPYEGLERGAPKDIFEFVQGKVDDVDERVVRLEGGKEVEYEYLVIATGTSSVLPSKVAATESLGAQQELRGLQNTIKKAARIAVVGGGAVGIELASDIKDFYPEKSVVLLHSRDRLLPSFGERLHQYVAKKLHEMGVEIWLNERPQIVEGSHTLKLKQGKEETFDLIVG
jgi:NADH dehydrogenase FAD-containing subunit